MIYTKYESEDEIRKRLAKKLLEEVDGKIGKKTEGKNYSSKMDDDFFIVQDKDEEAKLSQGTVEYDEMIT